MRTTTRRYVTVSANKTQTHWIVVLSDIVDKKHVSFGRYKIRPSRLEDAMVGWVSLGKPPDRLNLA